MESPERVEDIFVVVCPVPASPTEDTGGANTPNYDTYPGYDTITGRFPDLDRCRDRVEVASKLRQARLVWGAENLPKPLPMLSPPLYFPKLLVPVPVLLGFEASSVENAYGKPEMPAMSAAFFAGGWEGLCHRGVPSNAVDFSPGLSHVGYKPHCPIKPYERETGSGERIVTPSRPVKANHINWRFAGKPALEWALPYPSATLGNTPAEVDLGLLNLARGEAGDTSSAILLLKRLHARRIESGEASSLAAPASPPPADPNERVFGLSRKGFRYELLESCGFSHTHDKLFAQAMSDILTMDPSKTVDDVDALPGALLVQYEASEAEASEAGSVSPNYRGIRSSQPFPSQAGSLML